MSDLRSEAERIRREELDSRPCGCVNHCEGEPNCVLGNNYSGLGEHHRRQQLIESLQRENEELKGRVSSLSILSRGMVQPAITPEMRERIEKLILPKTKDKYWDSYSSSWSAQANRLLRDLLGEQG